MITGDKEKHSAANLQYLIHTSHPLAAVGVQPLRQSCVQHPVITFAQGVDERSGVRTTVEHFVEKPLNFDPFGHAELSLFAKI